ncbi:MAG: AAA family ATPase [Clostridia bacterium]|nr:AAA family ATPase [Clostridia bacterium]
MSAFERIIGYDSIKNELIQICDMIHNKDVYEKLGAKLPQGVLIHGEPGLGKTLMAKCFIEECGLETYTIRRNRGNDDFVGLITDVFEKAKENAPALIFLDDMDKFANEDQTHRNAEEYVAVQSGIDEIKGYDVFVLATANDLDNLPNSLLRSGRFDRKIEVECPSETDSRAIIEFYLSDKKVDKNLNIDDLAKMISYSSCADLENILNQAAINSAYERKDCIEIDDLVKAVLRMEYNSPENLTNTSVEELHKVALHEAGHLVVSEVLTPGSVGLASIRTQGGGGIGGFIHGCKDHERMLYRVYIALAGKAAVELYYSEESTGGCGHDIFRAADMLRGSICHGALLGFGMFDVSGREYRISPNLNANSEAVVQAELERFMLKTREILIKNRKFLEKSTEALLEKETLLFSDIKKIRNEVEIVEVTI